ncbi:hypothetical protein CRG98_015066 [Punica granatum]|uniref:Uncharacterized protein n=1 Tax=Punica granatum TaxID=22663 RepID=A0A2I0K8R5_PUNGR|nr:hypothetical protein CRG98_015066 [Punica granatum]
MPRSPLSSPSPHCSSSSSLHHRKHLLSNSRSPSSWSSNQWLAAVIRETCPATLSPPHHRVVPLLPLFITASFSRANVEAHRAGRPIEGLLLSFEAEKASIANVIRCSGKMYGSTVNGLMKDEVQPRKSETTFSSKTFLPLNHFSHALSFSSNKCQRTSQYQSTNLLGLSPPEMAGNL